MALTMIHDAGHGWLEVPLDKYPNAVKCGTGYGYLDTVNNVIYLEEDVEAHLFVGEYPEAITDIQHEMVNGDSDVRLLPRNVKHVA